MQRLLKLMFLFLVTRLYERGAIVVGTGPLIANKSDKPGAVLIIVHFFNASFF